MFPLSPFPQQQDLVSSIAQFMSYTHTSVNEISKIFLQNERRFNYTTPKSFLELISLYSKLLKMKGCELQGKISRLETGLFTLKSTEEQVNSCYF